MPSGQHPATEDKQTTAFALLSGEEMAEVHGGAIRVMVDGRTPATMDDLALNIRSWNPL
jgi:hypothetical protein